MITPSLDEMVHVAKEIEREGFDIPLLIGGATTSKVHTAVKIEQNYKRGQTIHVLDASRSVPVVGNLLGNKKDNYVKEIKTEYENLREHHLKNRIQKPYRTYSEALKNKLSLDFNAENISVPAFTGIKVFEDYSLEEISHYIDWTPFFRTWELAGKYPEILEDKIVGEHAQNLFNDAKELLGKIIKEKWLQAKAEELLQRKGS